MKLGREELLASHMYILFLARSSQGLIKGGSKQVLEGRFFGQLLFQPRWLQHRMQKICLWRETNILNGMLSSADSISEVRKGMLWQAKVDKNGVFSNITNSFSNITN